MRQLLKVLSAISPLHRHQIIEEARQRGSLERNLSSQNTAISAHSCSACSYLMRGLKFGELDTCNAFHSLNQNAYAANECPDWELKR